MLRKKAGELGKAEIPRERSRNHTSYLYDMEKLHREIMEYPLLAWLILKSPQSLSLPLFLHLLLCCRPSCATLTFRCQNHMRHQKKVNYVQPKERGLGRN